MLRWLLIAILLPFSALSAVALWQYGYVGLFTNQFTNVAGWQVLADLFIAVGICMVWMWRDAKKTGRRFAPWFVLSMVLGSFGPLLYLITEKEKHEPDHE